MKSFSDYLYLFEVIDRVGEKYYVQIQAINREEAYSKVNRMGFKDSMIVECDLYYILRRD